MVLLCQDQKTARACDNSISINININSKVDVSALVASTRGEGRRDFQLTHCIAARGAATYYLKPGANRQEYSGGLLQKHSSSSGITHQTTTENETEAGCFLSFFSLGNMSTVLRVIRLVRRLGLALYSHLVYIHIYISACLPFLSLLLQLWGCAAV